jgi:hypothetical protein
MQLWMSSGLVLPLLPGMWVDTPFLIPEFGTRLFGKPDKEPGELLGDWVTNSAGVGHGFYVRRGSRILRGFGAELALRGAYCSICSAIMSRTQRILLFLYCLLLAYSSIWIPWHRHVSATIPHWYARNYIRLGYGWLWAGPRAAPTLCDS